jgi:hypothetical protein
MEDGCRIDSVLTTSLCETWKVEIKLTKTLLK